ncbi:unnamed protein product [Bursaphelenchus okinawaensis]|uniref:Uncharacterized protein n=1 Tax=Bursaphelenchus okinawaensis TaxID=465554 RepID=A0A811LRB9_9BILA|nr:unnamed protein product [Bursaphelenchus okinawaensis]CAG9127602.1 unnamed protein product [Bursaphelenchus okinawaensis]
MQHQKPSTYKKNPLEQNQWGCKFADNFGCRIQKDSTFKSYDDLVHALIRYEMAARVHLLRSSSNFLKTNKKVNFSDETCRRFVFDRLVYKCPNHEVIKRYDSRTGEALYNKRVTKKNIEDGRKCQFTFTVQYNPEIDRLQISAGMLYHTDGCVPRAKDLFEYVPKDENNKKKRAIHKMIEERMPTQLPVEYELENKTTAFKSKNRTMKMPNPNAPYQQDTDAFIPVYPEEIEALISQYVADCVKKPAGEDSETGPTTSRRTKRRMADEGGVAAKKVNDGRALRPLTNTQFNEPAQDIYLSQTGPAQYIAPAEPNQPVHEGQAGFYSKAQADYQPAGTSQGYWNQPARSYEPYYSQANTGSYYEQSMAPNNTYNQPSANTSFYEQNWCQYGTSTQATSYPPVYYSQSVPNPVEAGQMEQRAYSPLYNNTFATTRHKETHEFNENNDVAFFNEFFQTPIQITSQDIEPVPQNADPLLAQNPLIDAPPIEEPAEKDPQPSPQTSPQYYYEDDFEWGNFY